MRPLSACALLVALAPQSGCDEPLVYPGDQLIGDFAFHVQRPVLADGGLDLTPRGGSIPICALEPDTGFDSAIREFNFEGTFSRCSGGVESPACGAVNAGHVYFTSRGASRDAGYDGQYAWLEPLAEDRQFTACATDGGICFTTVTETMRVALFSVSQTIAAGLPFRCPANALDGGVPRPDGDGGVTAPGFTLTDTGFDVVNACGELWDVVDASPGCTCVKNGKIPGGRCVIWYGVTGFR